MSDANVTPNPKNIAEWEKRCKESNGSMVLIPADLENISKEHRAHLEDIITKSNAFNKEKAIFENEAANFWFNFRMLLDGMGVKDIWEKGLGWNNQAIEDGVLVVNIRDN